ncbi:MAG: hypothetical protein FJW40_02950 [Acidobacteria bacterium]|nr:hypothetical protein [Acidobacteriota bacterium]
MQATADMPGRLVEAPGALGFVGFGSGPEPVPDHEVETIRTLTRSGRALSPHPYLRVGSRVRVETGPLDGVEGVLEQVRGAGRLVVSVNLLMRSVLVTLDGDRVAPLAVKGTSAGQHVQR